LRSQWQQDFSLCPPNGHLFQEANHGNFCRERRQIRAKRSFVRIPAAIRPLYSPLAINLDRSFISIEQSQSFDLSLLEF
jgi:hypothetical protein